MSANHPRNDSRRRFLKGLVIGGAAAGIAAGGSAGALAAPVTAKPANAAEKPARKGYQETAHVRRYYDLARG
ncbi:hypothetical protein [Sediminicurvatus halobius]|uniref:Formate dehydrogenase n=1 Tax=Sediminicurvatus halobius TaxID=2182432 RepID=A0A2U2MZ05_9GAMM|nr:hypothetical protein [Spiribacter halobius]PWG62221.1 hypothetical protein DEM34_13005 [Spiribacter halobius]UEX78129.1 hypothetical protein LMH63_00370 [Spiribacter halobius]